MIPARLTGKPFWDLYLYQDPPIWEAYIDCAKHFDIDSVMDGYFPLTFDDEIDRSIDWKTAIVKRTPDRIITQQYYDTNTGKNWAEHVTVFYRGDPPTPLVKPSAVGLPQVPDKWEPLEGVKPVDVGPAGLARTKKLMGDQGLVGVFVTFSIALFRPEDIYNYYDNPDKHEKWARQRVETAEKRFHKIMALEDKPDFLCVGGSGTLVYQTMDIFRQLAFPAVKRVIELASDAGIPTHVHSCGPEAQLVKAFAAETNLTVIDPLEEPPMGDCDLAELKKNYGKKITLKGNLHTVNTMLNGTVDDVIAASKKAIDAAAQGGRFILSTADQCGRDTPDENLRAMVETARTYGKY
jgi:uroporphyrinogen decarboxylase